ncbi:MAG TPA: HEAT repeat domain-containing protein [Bacteroidales bacterium]|nr:HEAT repeat domain-containing protein [Bacteroidales bacterium]
MRLFSKTFFLISIFFLPQLLVAQVAGTTEEKKAALHQMAEKGDPGSFTLLSRAAKEVKYKQDSTHAVSCLLLYASVMENNGNDRIAEKAAEVVIKNCVTPETNNFRVEAMKIMVKANNDKALAILLKAIDDKDIRVREAVMKLANTVTGTEATKRWVARYSKVSPLAKENILKILGERGDNAAISLVKQAMEDKNIEISSAAIASLAKLIKGEAVDPILSWMLQTDSETGHIKAADVLVTLLNHDNIRKVAAYLRPSKGHATATLIYLISWSGDTSLFDAVFQYTSSADIPVRAAAFSSLKNLATGKDIDNLLAAVNRTNERPEVFSLQDAMAVAAQKSGDADYCTDRVLDAMKKGTQPEKLIPVLAHTGGQKALDYVANQFENGNPDMKELCFDALQGWRDWSATSVLYNICVSGNNSYSKPALDAYIRLASDTLLTDDDKLALYEKIAPYALYPDSRAEMVVQMGFIKTLPAFGFVSRYLDDQDKTVVFCSALALANIALPDGRGYEGLYDQSIRQTLERVIVLLAGDEYSDTRDKIRNYINLKQNN